MDRCVRFRLLTILLATIFLLGAVRASAQADRPDAPAGAVADYEQQIRAQVIDSGAQRPELRVFFQAS